MERSPAAPPAAHRAVRLPRRWRGAPAAAFCHPRAEHLLPLLVCVGAAGTDTGSVVWCSTDRRAAGPGAGLRISSFKFG